MTRLRTIIALLTALSIALAPIGSAWASMAAHTKAGAQAAAMSSDMADMTDCEKMAMHAGQKPGMSDCPCCDTKNACPPEFCLSKCFHLIGTVVGSAAVPVLVALQLRPYEPARPPDWSFRPQPPPPRT